MPGQEWTPYLNFPAMNKQRFEFNVMCIIERDISETDKTSVNIV